MRSLFIGVSLVIVGLVGVGFYTDKTDLYVFPSLNGFPEMPVRKGNPVTMQGVELGRYLFYDSLLSIDYSMSCASCHKQEYAFSDGGKQFSSGRNGVLMQRNTPPLFNLAWYKGFFWDGRAKTIEEQVLHPISDPSEMGMDLNALCDRLEKSDFYKKQFKTVFGTTKIDSSMVADALGQFLRTLLSYRSKYDSVIAGYTYFDSIEYRGFVQANDMSMGDCMQCHNTDGHALATSGDFRNNGLDAISDPMKYTDKGYGGTTGKIADNGKFKVPSLRNVALTAPYMHDGRFATLEEVIDFYSEGVNASANVDARMSRAHVGGVQLTEEKKHQILAFLYTLTDQNLVNDPAYSNPFNK